jgi:pimeloyl-ACP methyl ester carboxylesterase
MDLNLTQRIILRYYKTKFKLFEKLSPHKAAASVLQLFFTPYITHRKLERPAIFHKAAKLSFTFNGNIVRGFKWLCSKPGAKTVLVCHGMNSCSYRFEKYVQLLLTNQFNVLAFDALGHGQSAGKYLNAVTYSEMIIQIQNKFGSVDGIIAHSVAGMATTFAMEKLKDENKKIVLIAPATETTSQVDIFFRILRLSDEFRKFFDEEILRVRGLPVSWYSAKRAVRNFQAPVLWIHDIDDMICPYKDTLDLQKENRAHLQFVTTKGLGHNKIYRDAGVQQKIIDFLLSS